MKKVLLTAGFLAGIGVVLAATTSGASSDFASVGQRAGFNEASSRIKTIFPEMVDEAKLKEKVIAAGCVGKSKADIISKTHELAAEMAFEISLLEAVRQEYSLSHLAEGEDSEVNEDTKEVLRTAVPGYKGLISSITSMASLNDVTRAVIEAVKQNYKRSTEDAKEEPHAASGGSFVGEEGNERC